MCGTQSSKKHNITAIIYDKRGRPLSIGQNSYVKTHTVQAHYAAKVGQPKRQFIHAEIAAIIKCNNIAKAHRIFISRYMKNGKPATAKPCPACTLAIKEAGIEIVEYTITE